MSGVQQQRRYQITYLSWSASINAWAMKDVKHHPATECDCSESRRKDKKVTQEGKHTGILISPFLRFDICAMKEVTTATGGECVAEIRVCALTSMWH